MAKTTTNPASTPDDTLLRAAEDFDTLRLVFGWLSAIFLSIEDMTKEDGRIPEAKLARIKELAGCGRYLACDWENTAERMTEGLSDELQAEAGHGN